jgi:hypothetical protein
MTDYNTKLVIQYSNDREYRASLREIFSMKRVIRLDPDLDEISRDEQDYDIDAASQKMDFIFERTSGHPRFQELYDIAASKMISMDRNIGLSVLFSYDYLALFHRCLCSFFDDPDEFDEANMAFVALKKKIE